MADTEVHIYNELGDFFGEMDRDEIWNSILIWKIPKLKILLTHSR